MKKYRDKEAIRLCMGAGTVLLVIAAIYFAVSKLSSPTTLLISAISSRDTVLVKRLISRGADVNVQMEDGMTPLMYAAIQGDAGCIKLLVASGAKVNARSSRQGETALLQSIRNNVNASVPKLLLDLGADPNLGASTNSYFNTPLLCAERQVLPDAGLIKALLKHGADPNAKNKMGVTPLRATSDKKIRKILMAAGAK